MTSIWENDFYETPPQPLYAFETVWNQYTQLNPSDGETLSKACTNIQVSQREIQMVPVYYGGLEFRYPARANNAGEISVTFAENNMLQITAILNQLFDEYSYDQKWALNTGNDTLYRNSFQKTANKIIVKLLKPDENLMYYTDGGSYSKKFIYHNCVLIKIDAVDLDVTSEEVVNINATFSYDYMTIEEGETVQQQCAEPEIISKESVDSNGNISKPAVESNKKVLPPNKTFDLPDDILKPPLAAIDSTDTWQRARGANLDFPAK